MATAKRKWRPRLSLPLLAAAGRATMVAARARSRMAMEEEALLFARYKMGMATVHKTAYWGQIELGGAEEGKSQKFNVIFDTGSGNMILPSSLCHGPGCDRHRKYALAESASGRAVTNDAGQTEAQISFGTGDIQGRFVRDKLCLGKICQPVNFIASVTQSAEPFEATPFDGILGLGFRDLSMGGGFNIMEEISKTIPNGMISFALTDDGPSSLTFGGYRKDLCASPMVWAPVTYPSYWQIRVGDITLNNRKTNLCPAEGCQVAVDTGTSMLAGPTNLVQELSGRVNVAPDCSNYASLPSIGFQVGDRVLNLRPDEYVDNDKNTFCSMSIMALDVPPPKGPLFIFGDPFLRRFVTAFDKKKMRVGFAVAKGLGGNDAIADLEKGADARTSSKRNLSTKRDANPVLTEDFRKTRGTDSTSRILTDLSSSINSGASPGNGSSSVPVEVLPLSAGMMHSDSPPTMASYEEDTFDDTGREDLEYVEPQGMALNQQSFLEGGSSLAAGSFLKTGHAKPPAIEEEEDFSDSDLFTIELHKTNKVKPRPLLSL
ncbi:unnamed protein product [Amoebophrya sp. A25]|nr:unnamed protein product [Amoebophrya sp. A25]|eukprot:GSA25T00026113001.1